MTDADHSIVERIVGGVEMTPEAITERVMGLSGRECLEILYTWPLWARPDQLPPRRTEWAVWLLMGGRGMGKTRAGAEWIIEREAKGYKRFGLIGETANDCRKIIVEGPSGILACAPPWNRPNYEPDNRQILWPSGARADLFSGDSPDQLRGPNFDTIWADELAKWRYPQEAMDTVDLALRLGQNPQTVITTTPRPIPILRRYLKNPLCEVSQGSTYANRANLSERFIERLRERYGTESRWAQQEILGSLLEDIEGALWSTQRIEETRLGENSRLPDMRRIIVGVDPQTKQSADTDSEEETPAGTGIIVCGEGSDQRGYVLEDLSADLNPHEWASVACNAYRRWQADLIVVERNNGGEMVRNTIQALEPTIPVKVVWASRGKIVRAEPVATLYENNRISHHGMFPDLEDEMVFYTGDPKEESPHRLDALVWGLTELFISGEDQLQHYDPTQHEAAPRRTVRRQQ